MNADTFRGRSVPAEPQHGSGGEPLRPQPMSAEVIEAYEAGFKAGQDARQTLAKALRGVVAIRNEAQRLAHEFSTTYEAAQFVDSAHAKRAWDEADAALRALGEF